MRELPFSPVNARLLITCGTAFYAIIPVEVTVEVSIIVGWVENSIDPEQTRHFAASDQGLHCLNRPVV